MKRTFIGSRLLYFLCCKRSVRNWKVKYAFILICPALLGSNSSHAETIEVPRGSCLKYANPSPFQIPIEYLTCTNDDECSLSWEGCRSCNCPVASLAEHIKSVIEIDFSVRESRSDIRSCEACDRSRFSARCINNICETHSK